MKVGGLRRKGSINILEWEVIGRFTKMRRLVWLVYVERIENGCNEIKKKLQVDTCMESVKEDDYGRGGFKMSKRT